MEQNYNEHNAYGQNPVPQQEQVPYNEPAPQQPVYQQPPVQQPPYGYQQPPYGYQQPYQAPAYPYPPQPMYPYPQPRAQEIPGMANLVNSAFKKGLASVILAEFPIASIVGIILGAISKKNVKEADRLAAQYGTKAPGKRTAAKVLGNIGLGLGIGMTIFWLFYFILIITLAASTSSYYYYY